MRNWGKKKREAEWSIPDGKKECLICHKWFKKPLSHVHQTHKIFREEYLKMFGLDKKHGILADSTKEKLQQAVKKNYEVCVERNLLKLGAKNRFKSDTVQMYTRSPQTIERLKKIHLHRNRIKTLATKID